MANTLDAVKKYAANDEKSVVPTSKGQGIIVTDAPSVTALKVADVLIKSCGGRLAEAGWHEINAYDLKKIKGIKNLTRAELEPMFYELRRMGYSHFDEEKDELTIGGLLDIAKVQFSEASGTTKIRWKFSEMFRELVQASDHWAVIDRQTMFALRSKYSILLFQHLSAFFPLKHIWFKQYTVAELRAILNVADGQRSQFKDLNRDVLKPAVAEINQLSRHQITMETIKSGRMVQGVKFTWDEKPDLVPVKRELGSSKTGRKARRDGTVETPALTFPEFGTIRDTQPWDRIARDNAPKLTGGHVPDLRKLADAFRKWCTEKSVNPDAVSIEKTFTTWCKSYSAR
jgi:hypothetical protein